MSPSAGEIRVATGALEKEAGKWDAERPGLESISGALAGMQLTRVEAGLFQIMFDAHEACRSQVEQRATEGSAEFHGIAGTLRHVAKVYRAEDDDRAHEIAGLW